MQKLLSLLRSCADDYSMIEEGDRIAVGVSGGKDSLTLLVLMAALQKFYPKHFTLEAVCIDMGLGGMDFSPVKQLCESLSVPFTRVQTEIGKIIFDYRKEKNPCSMCAKMRRGALTNALVERGYNKVALGHHYDDAVETFMMSLLYEGRISCFQPVTYLDRTGITQIRPMLYLTEQQIAHFAERQQLPVVHNTCPADKHTKREEIKQLVYELSGRYPDFKAHIFEGMQKLPLPEWGIASKKPLQRKQQKYSGKSENTDYGGGENADSDLKADGTADQVDQHKTDSSEEQI